MGFPAIHNSLTKHAFILEKQLPKVVKPSVNADYIDERNKELDELCDVVVKDGKLEPSLKKVTPYGMYIYGSAGLIHFYLLALPTYFLKDFN